MRRFMAIFLCASLCLGFEPEMVDAPEKPFTKRVLFVLDCSGSMDERDKIAQAVDAFISISGQAVDEMEIGIIGFGSHSYRWEGVPEEGEHPIPKGWAAMPSQEAVQKAQQWLVGIRVGSNVKFSTILSPALMAALNEERDQVTVVLITDGHIMDSLDKPAIVSNVENAIRHRAENSPIVLSVIAVGGGNEFLRNLARVGQGGYFRVPTVAESDEESPQPPQGYPH